MLIAVLMAITAATFAPVLWHDFLDWDDRQSVQYNPDFTPPRLENLGHYWTGPHLQFYVPVTYTALWTISQIAVTTTSDGAYVLTPGAFHAFNYLVHLCNAALVFVILGYLVRHEWAAWLGAAFFALHPLQAEPVAWVSSMYSSLSGFFALVATLLYLRFSDAYFGPVDKDGASMPAPAPPATHTSVRVWGLLGMATVAYALALLTKPSIILLPAILAILEVGLRRRPVLRVAGPLGFMTLVFAVPIAIITTIVQPVPDAYSPITLRPFIIADTLSFYLYKILLPLNLIPDYGRSPRWLEQQQTWRYLAFVAPVLLAVVCAAFWRRSRWPLVILGMWAAALLPMLGLKAFDYQRFSTVADRYLYFAMFMPAMLVAWALSRLWGRAAVVVMVCVLGTFACLTAVQTTRWRDSKTLFSYTLQHNPKSLAAQSVFAYFASRDGHYEEAIRGYYAALEVNPGDPILLFNIGNIHLRTQRWADAIEAYEQALKSANVTSDLYSNLAVALAQSNRPMDAIIAVEQALKLGPRNANAHLNAAIIYASQGRIDEARKHYQDVIRYNGNARAAERGLQSLGMR